MAEEDKLFQFMTKIYSEMQTGFKSVNERFDKVETEISDMKGEIGGIKTEISGMKVDIQKIGAKIDGEVIPKQQALFDGYQQHNDSLARVEQNVDLLKENVIDINNSISEIKEDINFIVARL